MQAKVSVQSNGETPKFALFFIFELEALMLSEKMTELLDNLEIYETDMEGEPAYGNLDFVTIVDSKKDIQFEKSTEKESFLIQIEKGISNDLMVIVLCHELEHYDVLQTLLNLNLCTKSDLEYHMGSDGIFRARILRERLHSNPSYDDK